MVTSELTGEVSMGVLTVFLVLWKRGRYIVPDQQGDMSPFTSDMLGLPCRPCSGPRQLKFGDY